MKLIISLIVSLFSFQAVAQINVDLKRCIADLPGEVPVYSSDFKWNMTLEEIRNAAVTMYKSEKRLAKRAYYDEATKSYVFPMDASRGGNVKIPEQFVKTIAKHV